MDKQRCGWANKTPLVRDYHDQEWGVPVHDDRRLFEFLILEGAQAGLSWATILVKRENYRQAFDTFDPERVAHYDENKIQVLLQNPGIVRNKLKIQAAIGNARAFLELQSRHASFDAFIWELVGGKPVHNAWHLPQDIPAKTPASDKISKELQKRGFKFVGSTICYAFMQAVGMVNDHTLDCFRHREIAAGDG